MVCLAYNCPSTGKTVKSWIANPAKDDDDYRLVTCPACSHGHLINLKTGKVLTAGNE